MGFGDWCLGFSIVLNGQRNPRGTVAGPANPNALRTGHSRGNDRIGPSPDRIENARAFISGREWRGDEALVLVSRNHELDRNALAAALKKSGIGYIGMIGSRRKVNRVFDALKQAVPVEQLSKVYAPLGLDIGADSPAEIAISVIAEILQVQRGRKGGHLRLANDHSS